MRARASSSVDSILHRHNFYSPNKFANHKFALSNFSIKFSRFSLTFFFGSRSRDAETIAGFADAIDAPQ